MDLLLTDLDAQLCARLPTYQHALASGKPFDSILAELRKLHDTLGPSSRKAPIVTSTGDSDDSALGKLDRAPAGLPDSSLREAIHGAPFQNAVRKINSIDLSTPNGPLEVIKEVFMRVHAGIVSLTTCPTIPPAQYFSLLLGIVRSTFVSLVYSIIASFSRGYQGML